MRNLTKNLYPHHRTDIRELESLKFIRNGEGTYIVFSLVLSGDIFRNPILQSIKEEI